MDAVAEAMADAKLLGVGFLKVMPCVNGGYIMERIHPENVMLRVPDEDEHVENNSSE